MFEGSVSTSPKKEIRYLVIYVYMSSNGISEKGVVPGETLKHLRNQPAIIDGMGKESDAAEIDRRIHTVVKMLASAKTSSYVIRFCSEKWGWVSEWRRNILPALAK